MSLKISDLGWLAGIIEGEGYIGFNGTPTIKIEMVDEDIIKRIAFFFKRPFYKSIRKKPLKDIFIISIHGTPAIEWIFTIYSFLSHRKQSQAFYAISEWKKLSSKSRDTFSCGHLKISNNIAYSGKYKTCRTCKNKRLKEYYHAKQNRQNSGNC